MEPSETGSMAHLKSSVSRTKACIHDLQSQLCLQESRANVLEEKLQQGELDRCRLQEQNLELRCAVVSEMPFISSALSSLEASFVALQETLQVTMCALLARKFQSRTDLYPFDKLDNRPDLQSALFCPDHTKSNENPVLSISAKHSVGCDNIIFDRCQLAYMTSPTPSSPPSARQHHLSCDGGEDMSLCSEGGSTPTSPSPVRPGRRFFPLLARPRGLVLCGVLLDNDSGESLPITTRASAANAAAADSSPGGRKRKDCCAWGSADAADAARARSGGGNEDDGSDMRVKAAKDRAGRALRRAGRIRLAHVRRGLAAAAGDPGGGGEHRLQAAVIGEGRGGDDGSAVAAARQQHLAQPPGQAAAAAVAATAAAGSQYKGRDRRPEPTAAAAAGRRGLFGAGPPPPPPPTRAARATRRSSAAAAAAAPAPARRGCASHGSGGDDGDGGADRECGPLPMNLRRTYLRYNPSAARPDEPADSDNSSLSDPPRLEGHGGGFGKEGSGSSGGAARGRRRRRAYTTEEERVMWECFWSRERSSRYQPGQRAFWEAARFAWQRAPPPEAPKMHERSSESLRTHWAAMLGRAAAPPA